jgi:cyclic-di-GMP-binding protein
VERLALRDFYDYARAMPSFDIVSKPNWPEIDNALNQAQKEIAQRFDFKDTETQIDKTTDGILIAASTEDRARAALSVLQDKLVKRKVSLKFLDVGKVEKGPKGSSKLELKVKDGIPVEKAREIVKLIKDQKLKVQAGIHETQVRVTGKNRDDLQVCIQTIRGTDFGLELSYINFRD